MAQKYIHKFTGQKRSNKTGIWNQNTYKMSLHHSINLSLFVFKCITGNICIQLFIPTLFTVLILLNKSLVYLILNFFSNYTTQIPIDFFGIKIYKTKKLFIFFLYYINPKVQQFASAANSRAICSIRGLWGNCGKLETGSISAQMRKSADNIRATMEFFDFLAIFITEYGTWYRVCVYLLWVLHKHTKIHSNIPTEKKHITQERIYNFFGCILIWMAKRKKKRRSNVFETLF